MRGSANVNSKLTDDDVAYIRKVYKPRSKQFGAKALGNKFNVDLQTIMNVVKFRTYRQCVQRLSRKRVHSSEWKRWALFIRQYSAFSV